MNGSDEDIQWLSDQRPSLPESDVDASIRARADLMAHATRPARLASVVAAPRRQQHSRGRISLFARSRRSFAMAAGVAVVAVAGVTGMLVASTHVSHNSTLAPSVANADIMSLANTVSAAPTTGDATLVFHHNVVKGYNDFTGADLYLDSGTYYYAEKPSGLSAAVSEGAQDFTLKPILDAMAKVSSSNPQVARAAFLKACGSEYGPGLQSAPTWRQDNIIWVAGIDVLGASYGRPAALAGMLRALATVKGVNVTHSQYKGKPTLEIAMFVPKQVTKPADVKRAIESKVDANGITEAQKTALRKLEAAAAKRGNRTTPAHYMRATVNARTGALLRYTDIGLVVTYRVSRVEASRYGS